jgi:hypothetical protein
MAKRQHERRFNNEFCPPGMEYVSSYRKKDGTEVRGYCKEIDPHGEHEPEPRKKYSSYREIEEDLNMTSSDAQAWADVHQDRLKGDLKREVEEWKRMFD